MRKIMKNKNKIKNDYGEENVRLMLSMVIMK